MKRKKILSIGLSFLSLGFLFSACKENPPPPPTPTPQKLLVNPTDLKLNIGQEQKLDFKVLMTDGSTKDTDINQLTSNAQPQGLVEINKTSFVSVKGLAKGNGQISFTYNGLSEKVTFNVAGPNNLILNPNQIGLTLGQKTQLTVTSEGRTTPLSPNEVTIINPKGLVRIDKTDKIEITALNPGIDTLKIQALGQEVPFPVVVTQAPAELRSIKIVANGEDLDALGAKKDLTLVGEDNQGNPINNLVGFWQSSNDQIVNLNQSGGNKVIATAQKDGDTKISVSVGNLKADLDLKVQQKATNLSVEPNDITLISSQKKTLQAKIADRLGKLMPGNVNWTVEQTSEIVILNTNTGTTVEITAKNGGTATVKATSGTLAASAKVTVSQVSKIEFESNDTLVFQSLREDKTVTARALDEGGNVVNVPLTFTLEQTGTIANMGTSSNNTAKVISLANGDAVLKVSYGNLEAKRTIKVQQVAAKLKISPNNYQFRQLNVPQTFTATITDALDNDMTVIGTSYNWTLVGDTASFNLMPNNSTANLQAIVGTNAVATLNLKENKTGFTASVSISLQIGGGNPSSSKILMIASKKPVIKDLSSNTVSIIDVPGPASASSCAISGNVGAFAVTNPSKTVSVYKISSDGTKSIIYTVPNGNFLRNIAAHPTNSKVFIIAEYQSSNNTFVLKQVDIDGKLVSTEQSAALFIKIVLARDGSLIYSTETAEIMRRQANGTITTLANGSDPSTSPARDEIVFTNKAGQISIVNLDGSNLRKLTNGDFNYGPSFSADGNQVIFSSLSGGIKTISRTGSDLKSYNTFGGLPCFFS